MRKVAVATTSRADYGLLLSFLKKVQESDVVELKLIVSGSHPSEKFDSTFKQILSDGFDISFMSELVPSGDSSTDIAEVIGKGISIFSEYFSKNKPDVLVVLGDRYEMYAVALAAYIQNIPLAHIHGGEVTLGALDDLFRHSMTKMSFLHFTSTEEYKKRVIQMGENPENVFCFGAPSLDQLKTLDYLTKENLEKDLNIKFQHPVALVTFHPETISSQPMNVQVENLLNAISKSNVQCIFTQSNADAAGQFINQKLKDFVSRNQKHIYVQTLGQLKYFSAMKYVDLMIGNSSSGIIETPSFGLPTINIGKRQEGRVRAMNVIDVPCEEKAIQSGIEKAVSKSFREKMEKLQNPYYPASEYSVGERIYDIISTINLPQNSGKNFYNIKF